MKLKFKKTPEQVELIKAMGSKRPGVLAKLPRLLRLLLALLSSSAGMTQLRLFIPTLFTTKTTIRATRSICFSSREMLITTFL